MSGCLCVGGWPGLWAATLTGGHKTYSAPVLGGKAEGPEEARTPALTRYIGVACGQRNWGGWAAAAQNQGRRGVRQGGGRDVHVRGLVSVEFLNPSYRGRPGPPLLSRHLGAPRWPSPCFESPQQI